MTAWDRFVISTAPAVVAAAVRALARTLDLQVLGEEHVASLWRSAPGIIYAIWHGQILLVPLLNERLRTRGARTATVMTSRSRDGELLARFARRFGLGVVRGSTSRGGTAALRRLARRVRDGHDVAVTPDGPRGPREVAQVGAAALAGLTGAPLVPLGFAAEPAWRLGSWDRLEVPKPAARAALVFGAPLRVAVAGDREVARKNLEAALREVTVVAGRAVGRE